jgi:hypothetical protein
LCRYIHAISTRLVTARRLELKKLIPVLQSMLQQLAPLAGALHDQGWC